MSRQKGLTPFVVKNCALVAIATGLRAQNLRELADRLAVVPLDSLYYHFWGSLLRPTFDDPEYNNDFASWARHLLHDKLLAERLAVIDPADFHTLEELRQEVIGVVEMRLDEPDSKRWAPADQQFHFVRSQSVVFDTRRRLKEPRNLATVVPELPLGSIYYHFIDSRTRQPNRLDDFRAWIEEAGADYQCLSDRLAAIDPYFASLAELRAQLAAVFAGYFGAEGAP